MNIVTIESPLFFRAGTVDLVPLGALVYNIIPRGKTVDGREIFVGADTSGNTRTAVTGECPSSRGWEYCGLAEGYTSTVDSFGNRSFFLDGDEIPLDLEVISKGLTWAEAHDWVSGI